MAHFTRIYNPLNISATLISIESSLIQQYDVNTQEYTPDRRIVPTIIQPKVSIIDPAGIIDNGNVNTHLTDIKWFENEPIEANEILDSDYYYSINRNAENNERGRITIRKNVSAENPITLIFQATFVDMVGNKVRRRAFVEESITLSTSVSADVPLVLKADYPRGRSNNPLKEYNHLLLSAQLLAGQEEVPSAFWWYTKAENGDLSLISDMEGHNTGLLKVPTYTIGKSQHYIVKVEDCRKRLYDFQMSYINENYVPGMSTEELQALQEEAKNITLPIGYRPTKQDEDKITEFEYVLTTNYPPYETKVVTPYGNDSGVINIPLSVKYFPAWVQFDTPKGTIKNPENYFSVEWSDGVKGTQRLVNADDISLGGMNLKPTIYQNLGKVNYAVCGDGVSTALRGNIYNIEYCILDIVVTKSRQVILKGNGFDIKVWDWKIRFKIGKQKYYVKNFLLEPNRLYSINIDVSHAKIYINEQEYITLQTGTSTSVPSSDFFSIAMKDGNKISSLFINGHLWDFEGNTMEERLSDKLGVEGSVDLTPINTDGIEIFKPI